MTVAELRETQDEDAKETRYQRFAETVWKQSQQYIEPFYNEFSKSGSYPKWDSTPLGVNLDVTVEKLTRSNIPLVKLLSFLCNFLDGKEINELLSAYIHKFENIQTFIGTLNELGESVKFQPAYELFNGNIAGDIANQLRNVVSIGKMKDDINPAMLYRPAVEMLGFSAELSKEWFEDNVHSDHPFRNFISNNVINSRRFVYLVRYTKPETVKALMRNRQVVHYVLSRIADIKDVHIAQSQIDRYYEILPANKKAGNKIDALADFLTGFSFDSVFSEKELIGKGKQRSADENVKIEKMKAQVGLYLTVAFIAVKNIVKTNARYYIAFAAFERDLAFSAMKLKDDPLFQPKIIVDGKERVNYFALTEYFLQQDDDTDQNHTFQFKENGEKFGKQFRAFLKTVKHHYEKRWRDILRNNIAEAKQIQATGDLLSKARNHAEHLNVLTNLAAYAGDFKPNKMTSYFQLYHYVLQQMMSESKDSQAWNIGEFADKVKKFHSPCGDWTKIMYVLLAYNLPRYKNLTIEALFDADSESGKGLAAKQQTEDKKTAKKHC